MIGPSALDSVVIGAGWAGLGVSHALKQRQQSHLVFERGRIGETWRSQRWDSFHLNTSNVHTVMPGDSYAGTNPDGALSCAEFVHLLEDFSARHQLPVETGAQVTDLVNADEGFRVTVSGRTLWARTVVLANGTQNVPIRPTFSPNLPSGLHQIDASDYRSATKLPRGAIMIVGSGQSGGQIADDLAETGRLVFLCTSRVGRQPHMYRGRHFMYWAVAAGLFEQTRTELLAAGPIATRPMVGARKTISLQDLSRRGVVLLGRLVGYEAPAFRFTGDVAENLQFADAKAAQLRAEIDSYIERQGLDAPPHRDEPAELATPSLPDPPILSLDPEAAGIGTVIWCTGFRGDFSWTRVPGLLDQNSQPDHEANFARVRGIFVPGVPFAVTRLSGTIHCVADEARRIADAVAARSLRAGQLDERAR